MRFSKPRGIGVDEFAVTLKRLRTEHDVSVASLAAAARVTEDYIYKMERGVTAAPADEVLERLCSAFPEPSQAFDQLVWSAGRLPSDVMRFVRMYPVFVIKLLRNLAHLSPSGLKYTVARFQSTLESLPVDRSQASATA